MVNWDLIEKLLNSCGVELSNDIDFTLINTRNDINPKSIYYFIKSYIDNVAKNKLPNIPYLNMTIQDAFQPKNMEILESIITTISKKHYFLKTFIPIPTNQIELDQLLHCLKLIHISHQPTLKLITDSIYKLQTPSILIDPVIIQSITKDEYFAYYIYCMRNLFRHSNYIEVNDVVDFFKPTVKQRKYLTKKIIKAASNKKFFRSIHEGRIYFSKLDDLLHTYHRVSTTGYAYFVPKNLKGFIMICHHAIATMSFLKDDKNSHGRSIKTIAKHTKFSERSVIKYLKACPRINRSKVIETFHCYEDALEYTHLYNLTNRDKFMFINKSFFRDGKETILNAYDCRLKESNLYVRNCIRTKVYIRDFHESFVLDKNTNKYKATNLQKEVKRHLSQYKTVNPDTIIEKQSSKPTIRPQFPFIPSDHPCHEKRHNPDKLLEYSMNDNQVDLSVFNNGRRKLKRRKKRSKPSPEAFLNLPCYHPQMITGRPARRNFIRFVVDPEYRQSIVNKYCKGGSKLEAFNTPVPTT